MNPPAYASLLCEENYGAIASEKPGFDREEARIWVEEHGRSFFIRDENNKQWDCSYMAELVFHEIYAFDKFDAQAIFHRLIRRKD